MVFYLISEGYDLIILTKNGYIFFEMASNMLSAGIDKTHRDLILGHALQGMDRYYISPDEGTLKDAMRKYTRWLDDQIAQVSGNLDQTLDQTLDQSTLTH